MGGWACVCSVLPESDQASILSKEEVMDTAVSAVSSLPHR